jgi:hypothetical protein
MRDDRVSAASHRARSATVVSFLIMPIFAFANVHPLMTALGKRDLAQSDRGLRIPNVVVAMFPAGVSPDQRRRGSDQKQESAGRFHFGEADKRAGNEINRRPRSGWLVSRQGEVASGSGRLLSRAYSPAGGGGAG